MEKGHEVKISQVTLFELSAKGAKYVKEGILAPETVTEGIRAILYDDKTAITKTYESRLLLSSFEFRKAINDFIDCLILSSAVNCCDALVTEDEEIHNLTKNNRLYRFITATNPNFTIKKAAELL
jgi:predicted nucleic-acid-binding protein